MKLHFEKKTPSFGYALFVMVAVFAVIMVPALVWGAKINALFLISWLVAILLCVPTGTTWKEIAAGINTYCIKAIIPIMIILAVGGLVGTWMAAGTVPAIISIGVQTVSPHAFLLTSFLLSAVCSVVTGTSWGTFGTAGLALAGIGLSLNVDPVMTAGAVCSGAFFGDTISPMSDSPNMASAVSGVELFTGIKHQAKVTVVSAVICCIIFWIMGLQYKDGQVDMDMISSIVDTIGNHFTINFFTFLPAIVVVLLLVLKVPSIPAILGGGVAGGLVACVMQGESVNDCITYFWSGFSIDTGVSFIDTLLNRGGVTSMSSTALMFLFSFGLFGIFDAAGIVDVVVAPITRKLNSKLSLVMATVGLSLLGNALSASMNFAYAFAGNIMAPVYEKKGLQKKNLMRALGVGCTAMSVIFPWSLSSGVISEFMGVTPMQILPCYFFPYVALVILIIWTLIGKDTKWVSELTDEERKKEEEYVA